MRKNPRGVTICDRHLRRLPGTYLKRDDIEGVFKSHNRKGILYPASGKIPKAKNADDYASIKKIEQTVNDIIAELS